MKPRCPREPARLPPHSELVVAMTATPRLGVETCLNRLILSRFPCGLHKKNFAVGARFFASCLADLPTRNVGNGYFRFPVTRTLGRRRIPMRHLNFLVLDGVRTYQNDSELVWLVWGCIPLRWGSPRSALRATGSGEYGSHGSNRPLPQPPRMVWCGMMTAHAPFHSLCAPSLRRC